MFGGGPILIITKSMFIYRQKRKSKEDKISLLLFLKSKNMRGFTLLELVVVMIIVGVLATLGMSQYGRTVERSRQAEAISILGALRGAQLRNAAENSGSYATPIGNLDVALTSCTGGPPATACQGKYFNYTVPGAPVDADLADAARNGVQQTAGTTNYQLRINRDGNITCQSPDCSGGP